MRDEKKLLLDEIEKCLGSYSGFVIVDYAGLTANEAAKLRFELFKRGTQMEVVRKRVLGKALSARGISLDVNTLAGHVGLIFATEDSVETVKFICDFSKEVSRPAILGGHFDGNLLDASRVKVLATLPSKDEMRAQLLALFVAPMSQTLSVVNALLCSVPHCLENKSKKES